MLDRPLIWHIDTPTWSMHRRLSSPSHRQETRCRLKTKSYEHVAQRKASHSSTTTTTPGCRCREHNNKTASPSLTLYDGFGPAFISVTSTACSLGCQRVDGDNDNGSLILQSKVSPANTQSAPATRCFLGVSHANVALSSRTSKIFNDVIKSREFSLSFSYEVYCATPQKHFAHPTIQE